MICGGAAAAVADKKSDSFLVLTSGDYQRLRSSLFLSPLLRESVCLFCSDARVCGSGVGGGGGGGGGEGGGGVR